MVYDMRNASMFMHMRLHIEVFAAAVLDIEDIPNSKEEEMSGRAVSENRCTEV
jgi:hypothetical protein